MHIKAQTVTSFSSVSVLNIEAPVDPVSIELAKYIVARFDQEHIIIPPRGVSLADFRPLTQMPISEVILSAVASVPSETELLILRIRRDLKYWLVTNPQLPID